MLACFSLFDLGFCTFLNDHGASSDSCFLNVVGGLVVLRKPDLAVVSSQVFKCFVLLFADTFVFPLLLTYNVNGHHQAGHTAQGSGDFNLGLPGFLPHLLVIFESGLIRGVFF